MIPSAFRCFFSKGERIMTLLPLTDCCLLLGVDPKTLRLWLTSAHLSCTIHPTDARLKCLTPSQLHHLAHLHDRFLPDPLPGEGSSPASSPIPTPPTTHPDSPLESPRPFSLQTPSPEVELRQQLTLLQAQVATLQQQVTDLALALVRERTSLCSWLTAPASTPLPASPALAPKTAVASLSCQSAPAAKPKAASDIDRPRSRSRALPLIESGADGHYVLISPTQGVLSLVPASPPWFDWLSSLSAFTFQSSQGRFSATRKFRDGQRIQSWNVHRSLHGRSCTLYLGLTPTLTLARLEDMAAAVHARLTAL